MSAPPAKKQRLSSMPAPTVAPGVPAIPIARVNKIIKADRDVRVCSKEAVFLIAKATELMLGKLALQAYQNARMDKRQKMVRYTDLADAVHLHPSWFYLGEVIPTPLPLKTALDLRQANEDLAAAPSAVTTAAPKKDLSGVKRVVKNKGGKGAGKNALSGLGVGGDGIAGEVGQRKTRGKKLKLPAGEGGPDEDDFDEEDGEYSEATGGAGASRAPSEAGMDVDA
ncbi:hypothetical protein JCM8097_002869 [Rhodosporidiobolus ruineniae]